MSFFSFSSGRKPYRNPNYGSGHYQRRGLLDKLGDLVGSFGSRRQGYYPPGNNGYGHQPPPAPSGVPGNVVHCSHCGSGIPSGSKFCLQCGTAVSSNPVCRGCGQPLQGNSNFCPHCGSPTK